MFVKGHKDPVIFESCVLVKGRIFVIQKVAEVVLRGKE